MMPSIPIRYVTPEKTWQWEVPSVPHIGEAVILDGKNYRVANVVHNAGMHLIDVVLSAVP